jgi:hypothetical protein
MLNLHPVDDLHDQKHNGQSRGRAPSAPGWPRYRSTSRFPAHHRRDRGQEPPMNSDGDDDQQRDQEER